MTINNDTTTNAATLVEFFYNLPSFVIVENSLTGVHYASTGRFLVNDAGVRTHVKLLNISDGFVTNFRITDEPASLFSTVEVGGEPKVLDSATVNLVRTLLQNQVDIESYRGRFMKANNDWDKLGGLLMKEANDRDWCSEYDRLVDSWNSDFELLELPVRKKTYNVEVSVTATYTVTVQVEAEDDDAAIDEVNDMSAHDIMLNSGGSFSYPDDTEYEVNGCEAE